MEDEWYVIAVYDSGAVRVSTLTADRPRSLEDCLAHERTINERRANRNVEETHQINVVYMVVHRKHMDSAMQEFR
jgi:hypothetical protein